MEEDKEMESVFNATRPRLVGLEGEELERRRSRYYAPPLGELPYKRQVLRYTGSVEINSKFYPGEYFLKNQITDRFDFYVGK